LSKKSSRSEKLYVEDMILAIEKVMSYTRNFDFSRFENDEIIKDAVLFNMQIVGEAANKIGLETQQKYSNIPWRDMADFRIIVAHIYFSVSYDKVWELITLHLPQNLIDLKQILNVMAQE
jgi:uncharacterized protein with HEPN domain